MDIASYHFNCKWSWVADTNRRIEVISIDFFLEQVGASDIKSPVAVHEFCEMVSLNA